MITVVSLHSTHTLSAHAPYVYVPGAHSRTTLTLALAHTHTLGGCKYEPGRTCMSKLYISAKYQSIK